jgi:hypothetical protein
VTEEDSNESFDLSASYREVVNPCRKIALFSREHPLMLREEVPVNAHTVNVYGIPVGARINTLATEIKDFASSYQQVAPENIKFSGNFFTINEAVRNAYAYIAVQYDSIDEYSYVFTNYEREIFDGSQTVLNLEKAISKNNEDIILYGIPNNAAVHKDYLYRVPNEAMMNSIDYYADIYDELPVELYDVNPSIGQIKLRPGVADKYKAYIVDYLKNNSYCLNHDAKRRQYEIDVATDAKKVSIHYDMHEDGGTYKYSHTDIRGNEAGYIVLRRREIEKDED